MRYRVVIEHPYDHVWHLRCACCDTMLLTVDTQEKLDAELATGKYEVVTRDA